MRRSAFSVAMVLGGCVGSAAPPSEDATTVPIGSRTDSARAQATEPTTTPLPPFDVTYTLPLGAPEASREVDVSSVGAQVDVHLLIDTTASFQPEITELKSELNHTIVTGLHARVGSLTLGVSKFQDYPYMPYGIPTDRPYKLLQRQTMDTTLVMNNGVNLLDYPLGNGADQDEAWAEALFQVATGAGILQNGAQATFANEPLVAPYVPSPADVGQVPGVGWRRTATRVVVIATDASPHDTANGEVLRVVPGAHGIADARNALVAAGIRVVGLAVSHEARVALEQFATATGAVVPAENGGCPTGLMGTLRPSTSTRCPLVFDLSGNGSGLSATVVNGIVQLLDNTVYNDVHGVVTDDPQGFVYAIEATPVAATATHAAPTLADHFPQGNPDAIDDTYVNVRGDTPLRFLVRLRNDHVAAQPLPQTYYVTVNIIGDGTVLETLRIRIIVPEGPKFDAGNGSLDASAVTGEEPAGEP